MTCPKCGKQLIQESASVDGKTCKVRCASCGFTEVRDRRGCGLLTEVPERRGDLLLG